MVDVNATNAEVELWKGSWSSSCVSSVVVWPNECFGAAPETYYCKSCVGVRCATGRDLNCLLGP